MRLAWAGFIASAILSCRGERAPPRSAASAEPADTAPLEESIPEAQGVDSDALCELTEWVKSHDAPIFSILISRNDKLVYELYTSHLTRDHAHYIMSATKTVTSALIGLAIDAHTLPGTEAPITELLPAKLFPSEAQRARLRTITLKDVLGMSALDALVPPHLINDETRARQKEFLRAPNRAAFALSQAVLPEPGSSFQYQDVTPQLATGALEYATHETAFDFAQEHLFRPLGFRNAEWMHEDAEGIDNGAYGLRMRPVDMQKFGILYADGGIYGGHRILSEAWVDLSLRPWIKSKPALDQPNYGWYWWTFRFSSWEAHEANGWKGQRIAVVREPHLVVTMTGDINKGEDQVFVEVMRLVQAATKPAALPTNPSGLARLQALLQEVHELSRIPVDAEPRMIPSVERKERHHPFAG